MRLTVRVAELEDRLAETEENVNTLAAETLKLAKLMERMVDELREQEVKINVHSNSGH